MRPSILPGTPKTEQLTDGYIKALRPGTDRYEEFYGRGFGVRVSALGTKSWVYAYRIGKQKRWMTLGTFPRMSLAHAREAHRRAENLVLDGIDPVEDALAATAKAAAEQAQRNAYRGKTLREVFDDFQALRLKLSNAGGRKDDGASIRAEFAKHVFPTLGDVPLREVRRPALLRVIDNLKLNKPSTAFHLFRDLQQFLNWAVRYEEIDRSPFTGYTSVEIVGRPSKGERKLIDWELTRFYRQLSSVGLQEVTKLALRFMLATGQRSANVVGLPKAELSDDETMWVIPRNRFKGGKRSHDVPLSKHARRILHEAARFNHGSRFVFPSPTNKSATVGAEAVDDHILERSVSQALRKKLGREKTSDEMPDAGTFGLAKFTPHDLRRTLRTGLARLGYEDAVAEKVIGHVLGGVNGIYNRHNYANEKREALEAWGEHLDVLAARA